MYHRFVSFPAFLRDYVNAVLRNRNGRVHPDSDRGWQMKIFLDRYAQEFEEDL